MKITLGNTLPPYPDFVEGIRNSRPWLHTCSGAGQVISGGNFHDLPLAISYDFL